MNTKYFTTIFLLIIISTGCHYTSPSDKILEEFEKVDRSLDTSMQKGNEYLYKNIAGKANISFLRKGDSLYEYIASVKGELKERLNGTAIGDEKFDELADKKIVAQLMIDEKKADTVLNKVNAYAKDCKLNEIPGDAEEFAPENTIDRWRPGSFKDLPSVAALTFLTMFQNKISASKEHYLLLKTGYKGVGAFSEITK